MYNFFLVWLNRSKLYWNLVEDAGFSKEYIYIRTKLGIIKPYKKKK